jgi:membrane protein implicated in regulation of membrane protease activity
MWQITWMLGLLPDWLWTALLISSTVGLLASLIAKHIPFVSNYRFPIQIISFVGLLISVWFLGAASANEAFQSKIKDLEEKVRIAEEQANNKNVEVQERVVEKTKVVKEKGKDIIKYIDREIVKKEEIVKYVEQCPVPKEIIDIHNQAADLNKAAEGKK